MIRLAQPTDDDALRHLAGRPMRGAVSLAFTTEPSYFEAIRVHGFDTRVLVAGQDGRIDATGFAARRRAFVNGVPMEVGYLGGLRVDAAARAAGVLARGYRWLETLHQQDLHLPLYFTSILHENSAARALLTSGRAGLPGYHELGLYETTVIPVIAARRLKEHRSIEVLPGARTGREPVRQCLDEFGPAKQLFPVYSESDFDGASGALRGLALDDFLVAVCDGKPLGTIALWDQRRFRQIRVLGYSPGMRLLKTLSYGFARFLPVLPQPGEALHLLLAACITARENDPEIFALLLSAALKQASARGAAWLATGLFRDDPLSQIPRSYLHWTLASQIYRVVWRDELGASLTLDRRSMYLELGSL